MQLFQLPNCLDCLDCLSCNCPFALVIKCTETFAVFRFLCFSSLSLTLSLVRFCLPLPPWACRQAPALPEAADFAARMSSSDDT